jgi:PAS domain S-box-containing protein
VNKDKLFFKEYIKGVYLVTAFLVVVLYGIHYVDNNTLESKYKTSITSSLNYQKIQIEKKFQDITSELLYLSKNPRIEKVAQSNNPDFYKNSKINLINFMDLKGIYDQFRYIDNAGQEILRADYKNKKAYFIDQQSLQNKYNRYYVKDALKLPEHSIYISKFDLNMENGKVEIPYKPMIRFSLPMYHENQIKGLIVVNYLGKNLIDSLKAYNKLSNTNTTLLNGDGYYLSSPNSSLEWGFMFKDKQDTTFVKNHKKLWDRMKERADFSILEDKENIYTFAKINPYRLMKTSTKHDSFTISDSMMNVKDWYILNSVSKEMIHEQSIKTFIDYFWFIILIYLILLGALYSMVKNRVKLQLAQEQINVAYKIFENTSEGMVISDENNNIILINKAFKEITGYSESEVIGKNPRVLNSGETDKNKFENMWHSLTSENIHGWTGELWNKRKNGELYPASVKINALVDDEDNITNFIAISSDITKRKEEEEKLKTALLNEEQAREELEHTQAQMIESEKMAALGQLISGIAHEINTPIGAINSSADNIDNSINNIFKLFYEVISELDDEELKESFVNIITEHSDHQLTFKEKRAKKKEIEKILKEKGIANGRKIADIAINNGFADDLDRILPFVNLDNQDKVFNTINKVNVVLSNTKNIAESVKRISKIIFALKNYARTDNSGEMSEVRIEDEIENVIVLHHNSLKQGIEVIREYESLEAIKCFPDQLNQVWSNLIQNAIHAMNYKGKLTIKLYKEDSYQVVKISDTGTGIGKDIIDKIFKPLFTTKAAGEGTGLGLDIVKKMLTSHSGDIKVESEIGVGTSFYVYLPIKEN